MQRENVWAGSLRFREKQCKRLCEKFHKPPENFMILFLPAQKGGQFLASVPTKQDQKSRPQCTLSLPNGPPLDELEVFQCPLR